MARYRRIRRKRAVTHQPGKMRSEAGHRASKNAEKDRCPLFEHLSMLDDSAQPPEMQAGLVTELEKISIL